MFHPLLYDAHQVDLIGEVMMRLLAVLAASSVLALTPAHSAYFGIGISSCANWQTPGNETQGKAWILGFFSGMSAMDSTGRGVGDEIDGRAILAEVALICAKNPSMKLRDAVYKYYLSLR
jgi:hypothetical protein